MKILHVEAGVHLYGGARQVAYIIEGLAALGIENTLACPEDSAIAKAAQNHATILEMPMKGDADMLLFRRLKKAITQHRPDLVHLHSRRGADIWGGLAAKACRVPCVLSRRVDNPESRFSVALKYRLYDHVIAISDAIRQVLIHEGLSANRVTTVRSAVDPTPYLRDVDHAAFCAEFSLPLTAIPIGIVAQLIPRKGHRYLFDAALTLREPFPNLSILCFGQGALREELERDVKEKGIAPMVRFCGFRADLPQWLGGLSLLAHPADAEGLGVSLLQAQAAGVPVVASKAGGLPEAIADGKTGILVEAGDSAALGHALSHLLANPGLRAQMGAAGRQRILEEFSVSAMTRGNLAVYQKVLNFPQP